jgi:hypothetical protein
MGHRVVPAPVGRLTSLTVACLLAAAAAVGAAPADRSRLSRDQIEALDA